MRIVVIDDAPFIREIVRRAVESQGHQVIGEAGNGEEGLECVLERDFDLVLLDLVLPGLNGVQLAKQLIEAKPDSRILAFSSEAEDSLIYQAIEAGCEDFLAKPFTAQQLIQAIDNKKSFSGVANG